MRKEKVVTIAAEGRDNGKRFLITEMPAAQAEKWAARALMALGTSGIQVPQEMADAGIVGVALIGYQAFMGMPFDVLEPLMDEMLLCVRTQPSDSVTRPFNANADVEEVATLITLRAEVLEIHTGFTVAALASRLQDAAAALRGSSTA